MKIRSDVGDDPSNYADPLTPEPADYFEREAQRDNQYRVRTGYLTAHVGWECKAVASLTENASSAPLGKSIGWPNLVQVALAISEYTVLPEHVCDSDEFLGFIVRKLHSVSGDGLIFPWHCNGDFALEVVGWISESGMFSTRDALLDPPASRAPAHPPDRHTAIDDTNGDSCPR